MDKGNKGFFSITILAIIGLSGLILVGGGLSVYKYTQISEQNTALEQQLIENKDREIENLKRQLESTINDSRATSSDGKVEEGFESSSNESSEIKEVVRTVTEYVPVPPPSEEVQSPPVQEEHNLIILNVEANEIGDTMYITWSTNLDSESRIIIDDNFYVSDSDNSTEHSIAFSDLPGNSVINYEIVATAGSLETSKFGKFTTRLGELNARFEYSKDEECIVVIIEDDNEDAQSGILIEISSDWYSPSSRFLNDTLVQYTSSWGEVEYCEKNIENIKVENKNTGKVYYSGILPIPW